ncbi:MAG: permease YjgP/YjgQ family protein [Ignavibacteria bacterium]|nr:MAG: permease YjgP/YjgQ family protein [Ignavibacteria bacterium]KAF0161178.1 MAG: permease YjgP/YjgQ family protein [Ignavibacteria bacterium]
MKILDKYLVKQFLQTLLFALLSFTLIFVVLDAMENLDDFIDESVEGKLVFQYYLVFIPEMIRIILPISVLLASLFTAGKLANLNELTAIKASGVSLYRLMIPLLITAVLISLFTVYFSGYLVPMANKHKVFIEQAYMKKGLVHFGSNIFFQDTESRIVTINYFDVSIGQANQISIQEFDSKDKTKIISRTDAFRMTFDSTKNIWQLFSGSTRFFYEDSEQLEKFLSKEFPSLHFKPEDVIKKQRKPEEMTLSELSNFSQEQIRTGNDATRTDIAYHSRIAFAFSSIIVVMFGLPISANRRRGGLAIQFGISMAVTFLYLVFMKISQAFGNNGVFNPIFTAWLANFIFLIVALVNLKRVMK